MHDTPGWLPESPEPPVSPALGLEAKELVPSGLIFAYRVTSQFHPGREWDKAVPRFGDQLTTDGVVLSSLPPLPRG